MDSIIASLLPLLKDTKNAHSSTSSTNAGVEPNLCYVVTFDPIAHLCSLTGKPTHPNLLK